jgi:hypothetical protein
MTAASVVGEYDSGVSFGHRASGGYTGSGVLEYDISVSFGASERGPAANGADRGNMTLMSASKDRG